MTNAISVGYSNGHVTLDELRILPDGSIWIAGWSPDDGFAAISALRGGETCVLAESYRTYRPDVSAALGDERYFLGFEAIYAAPASARITATEAVLEIRVDDACVHRSIVGAPGEAPHYANLLYSDQVFHRDDIYGSGPPQASAAEEVLALSASLKGRILDFGCGSGFLVDRMRTMGLDAQGIEIDRPAIRQSLLPQAAAHVRLYDGALPLPFADGHFDAAIAVEVVEHIVDYTAVVAELARITRQRLILTVPDASAIPRLFHANVVPWHLLEGTHFNFFNQRSLRALLSRYFRSIHLHKIGMNRTEGLPWCTSLVAVCEK